MSVEKLGSGTYGNVTKVIVDGQPLARKVCTSPQYIELEVLKGVSHPCLGKLIKYAVEKDPDTGKKIYVTYFPLYEEIKAPTEKYDEFISQMLYDNLSALMTLRARGWYHRDLKPSNIMFDPTTKRYVLIDFGLCQKDTSPYTHSHFTCSEVYRPPIMRDYPGRYPIEIPVDPFALALSIFCILSDDDDMDSYYSERKIRKRIPVDEIDDELLDLLFSMLNLEMSTEDAYKTICEYKKVDQVEFDGPTDFSYKVKAENGKRLFKLVFSMLHKLNLVKRCLHYAMMLGLKYLDENPAAKIPLLASATAFLASELVVCDMYYAPHTFDIIIQDKNFDLDDVRHHAEQIIRTVGGVTSQYDMPDFFELLTESQDYEFESFYEELYETLKIYRINQ